MRKILLALSAVTLLCLTAPRSSATTLIVPASHIIPAKADPDPAKVKAAIEQFKHLSRHDRKLMLKNVNNKVRDFKKEKHSRKDDPAVSTLLLVILAILLPPLAVYLHEGVINGKFWLDLILTLLFWLPGLIYALIVVLS
jgi:uncharacterized membrane protein YqaE (UPF0057 family)